VPWYRLLNRSQWTRHGLRVDAQVHLTYNNPMWIAARHGIGAQAQQTAAALTAALAAFARHATTPD
jgi:hypothetical protein